MFVFVSVCYLHISHNFQKFFFVFAMSQAEERSRKAAKGWLTRVNNQITKLLDVPAKDRGSGWRLDASTCLEEFSKRMATFDEAQSAVEAVIDEDKLIDDIEENGSFRDVLFKQQARLVVAVHDADATGSDGKAGGSVTSSGADVKLPKLDLPSFDGKVEKWMFFWESFDACVNKSDLPEVQKLTYLRSLLKGDAAKAVEGLALTACNYKAAVDLLSARYGRPEKLKFIHIQSLLHLEGSNLVSLRDSLLPHIRSLEALGVGGDKYGVILTPLVLSKLPESVRMEWARDSEGHEDDLKYLLEFLDSEIRRLERSGQCAELGPASPRAGKLSGGRQTPERSVPRGVPPASGVATRSSSRLHQRPPAASALAAAAKPGQVRCGVCSQDGHVTAKCSKLLKMPVRDRHQELKCKDLCFRCQLPGHRAAVCDAVCSSCKGKHHAVTCFQTHADQSVSRGVNLSCTSASPSGGSSVVLPTASVTVKGARGDVKATVLFDSGSNRSYVSSSLVARCAPEFVRTEELRYAAFGGKESESQQRRVYRLHMQGACVAEPKPVEVEAAEVRVICAPLVRPSVSAEQLALLGNLELADPQPQVGGQLSIDILVGLDWYWSLMGTGCLRTDGGPVAQQTVFGWILSGPSGGPSGGGSDVSHQLLVMTDVHESRLRQFWDLDAVGISDDDDDLESNSVLKDFESSIRFHDGRYEVKLPWKEPGPSVLESNRKAAEVRLRSLDRKFEKDPSLQAEYDAVLEEMETLGIIEEVPEEELTKEDGVFYLPHRPVVRESSSTTKVRPVFDASAKGPNLVSLNDCLEAGPCLLPDLVEVLLRFRRWRFAVCADIRKAFLMIGLCEPDRDVHRFLWRKGGSLRTMRFTRVTFGVKSSPFLLAATLRHHLKSFPSSPAVAELEENMYVDDLLTGADNEEDALALFRDAREVLSPAGMDLAKLSSNSRVVLDKASSLSGLDGDECHKVLGVDWKPSEDVFSFSGVAVPDSINVTKRVMLSFIARMFDPIGFFSAYIMTVKLLFQETWRLGLEWDDVVPQEIGKRFLRWVAGLEELKEVTVPRSYCAGGWCDVSRVEIHAFGDASEVGYGAAVYLRLTLTDGSVVTPLVMSRGRVAPVKRVSLPRLELLGSLLAARLVCFVRRALKLPLETEYRCWTDSMIVLGWIRGDPSRWKQFVRNRVVEIQELTDPGLWSHCPGRDNPADLITRGVYAEELTSSSVWFSGPEWLQESCEHGGEVLLEPEVLPEEAESSAADSALVTVAGDEASDVVVNIERFSSLTRAIRVVGLALKFIRLLKQRSAAARKKLGVGTVLTQGELSEAKDCLIRLEQLQAYPDECAALTKGKSLPRHSQIASLCPFLDDSGILRVKSRLANSDMSLGEKCPILVPKGHFADLLIRFQHGLLKHAGVETVLTSLRCEYWIVGVRRAAKRVKRACLACQRQDAAALNAPVAPLPEVRASKAPPFAVTGIDFFGPLFILPKKKVYVCLFTCAVTRAIHLELVDSLGLADFLLAFKRFCARRGTPATIYSDNARTFVSASSSLRAELGPACPEWKFIAPRAAWWGGFWEKMVRSVKSSLRKTLGNSCLTKPELETCLVEVEGCINSRPLTFVGDEIESSFPLTPAHFLSGRVAGTRLSVHDDSQDVTGSVLQEKELEREKLMAKFWTVWQNDYLRSLPHSVRKFKSRGRLQVGSVVLIREDNVPRLRWAIGVVTKLHPGSDGVVRAADIRTAGGVRTRPLQRLHDLEMLE